METIEIRMLGEFSLRMGDKVISDAGNRAHKVWGLLAYLVCHRGQVLSQKRLMELLWSSDSSSNPENALRITLHRARQLLDQLMSGTGRACILHRDGGYCWNRETAVWLDCDRFDELIQKETMDASLRLERLLEAVSLYRGEFLPRQSSEPWVISVSTHFQTRFLTASLEAAALLDVRGRHREAADLCRRAIAVEPYHEPAYQMLMKQLAAIGDGKGAANVYSELSRRLFDDFGIRPSEETRAIYRVAAYSPEERLLMMDEVLEDLQEPELRSGAMECDYDYFKVLCYAESRAMERSGNATHVALLSVSGPAGKPLSKRSMNRIMEQLGEQLRTNLRRGDVISRCSVSQYIMMLPNANYENSCMVSRRVIAAFNRAHPHCTATIHFLVQPLTPRVCVP